MLFCQRWFYLCDLRAYFGFTQYKPAVFFSMTYFNFSGRENILNVIQQGDKHRQHWRGSMMGKRQDSGPPLPPRGWYNVNA